MVSLSTLLLLCAVRGIMRLTHLRKGKGDPAYPADSAYPCRALCTSNSSLVRAQRLHRKRCMGAGLQAGRSSQSFNLRQSIVSTSRWRSLVPSLQALYEQLLLLLLMPICLVMRASSVEDGEGAGR